MALKCGFIGLGSQGAPMARRMIDAGLPVVLWARRQQSLDQYRETPAQFAATVAELGAQVDYVGICVVDDADVMQVCHELIPAMRPGAQIVIHSTVHPQTCRTLAQEASTRGLSLIDAPVSGGAPGAQAGALTVMVGGSLEAFEAAKPVLETFGRLIVHLGGIGAGQHAKLINNTLLAANISAAHHALLLGMELGIPREALVQLLQASSGRSFGLDVCARMTSPANFAHGAALLEKDVRLLGEVLGTGAPAFAQLRAAAVPFLNLASTGKTPQKAVG